jgi:hypothetical protein
MIFVMNNVSHRQIIFVHLNIFFIIAMKNVLTALLYSLLFIPTVRTVLTVIYNNRNFTIKLFQNAQGFFLYRNTVYGANFYLSQIFT